MRELKAVLKKFKRRKAKGPDGIPMEVYKELNSENKTKLLELLNSWWEKEDIPEETLIAKIIFIYKKGDTSNLENYRPIALLNAIYKIIAAITQRRLAEVIEPHLQKMQQGYRKNHGTAQAIQCVRRIADVGDSTQTRLIMVLLDWEKAFDKISREALFSALERMGIKGKLLNICKELYKNPRFYTEVDEKHQTGTLKRQE